MRKLAVRMVALLMVPAAVTTGSTVAPTPAAAAAADEGGGGGGGGSCRPIEEVRVTDLGDLGGEGPTDAVDLNDRGEVVGSSTTPSGDQHAYVWRRGVMTDLTPSLRGSSWAAGINDRGQILVGWTEADSGQIRSFLWERGRRTEIDAAAGGPNERGQLIVGSPPSLWDRGTVTDVPQRFSDDEEWLVVPFGLGDGGHVFGTLLPVPGPGGGHPPWFTSFVWKDGTLTRLRIDPYYQGSPRDIDRRGRLLVNASRPGGGQVALLWDDGRLTDLGSLAGASGEAGTNDMNDRGQVVGSSTTTAGDRHAFLWQDGDMIDLDGVVGRQSYATAIGDRGHVIVTVTTREDPLRQADELLWWCGETVDLSPGATVTGFGPVNARGQVIGPLPGPRPAPRVALYTPR